MTSCELCIKVKMKQNCEIRNYRPVKHNQRQPSKINQVDTSQSEPLLKHQSREEQKHKTQKQQSPKEDTLPKKEEDLKRTASERSVLFKELGIYGKPLKYGDFTQVQQIIEDEYKSRLINDSKIISDLFERDKHTEADYKLCLEKLVQISENQCKATVAKKYNKMLEFKTVKKLGAGLYGEAFLITKFNDDERFTYEIATDKNSLNGKKNFYVLKKITFPKEDDPLKPSKLMVYKRYIAKEIKVNQGFFHPNIGRFFGAYSTNFFCALIYEYLCCGTVLSIIDEVLGIEKLGLYKKRMLFYSSQLLLALEYLHERGIYHGDINEGNICLDYKGYVKLIDFGTVIENDQKVESNRGIITTIARIRHINDDDVDQFRREYSDILNKEKRYHEIDILGVSMFFNYFYIDYKVVVDEEISRREAGILVGNERDVLKDIIDEIDTYHAVVGLEFSDTPNKGLEYTNNTLNKVYKYKTVPTAKELRQNYPLFKEMDFTRLLLRGFCLEKELQLDLAKRFHEYSTNKNLVFKESEEEEQTIPKQLILRMGIHGKKVVYEDYKCVQQVMETEYKSVLNTQLIGQDINYDGCLQKLVEISNQKRRQDVISRTYNEMPEFETIKIIGFGSYGECFLIVKSNDHDHFDYEIPCDQTKFKGKKNLYALKKTTFPDDGHIMKELLMRTFKNQMRLEIGLEHEFYHPNICRFFGAYSTNFFCVFVHEYLCCGTLQNMMNDDDVFIEDLQLFKKRVLFYSSQMMLALEYLHERGTYHADINVGNICLDYRGYAKLIDFGNVIMDGQEITEEAGIIIKIAACHIKEIKGLENKDELEYRREYSQKINKTKRYYELDLFGISQIFFKFCHDNFNLIQESYDISLEDEKVVELISQHHGYVLHNIWLAEGVYRQTIGRLRKNNSELFTVKELREDRYFEEMDFFKLLCRGFDLKEELELDLEKMFNENTHLENLIFKETKDEFRNKNDMNYLRGAHSEEYCDVFSRLSEHKLN